jgi:hypothetical protein
MNPTQRHASAEQRRQQIAALYLQGHYQSAITQQIGVSQQQVSYDLKALRKAWLASALRDFDALKSEQLARIDAVERAAWEAWERSRTPRTITVQETTQGEHPTTKASLRTKTQVGDARFLERVQKCLDQRADLLGFSTTADAPKALGMGLAALLAQAKGPVPMAAPLAEA